MKNIFEQKKLAYEETKKCSWDDVPQENITGGDKKVKCIEKLQYLILKQRYSNLNEFLKQQQEKYGIDERDIEKLRDLLFFYNDLKEINFIGTDMYANALFLKHKVPYLYRSVSGKDNTKEDRIFGNTDIEYKEHTKTIFKECLNQIETGAKGKLFSYTKCFGKMLYKYLTLLDESSIETIKVRKNAIVNSISKDGKDFMCIQEYIRECATKDGKSGLPYFAIDMSNARDNSVKCLKAWITEFLGEQEWYWHKDIIDPIGDAEVVCNFANEVEEKELSRDEFCVLLYKYFSKYADEIHDKSRFDNFIDKTLDTLKDYQDGELKGHYEKIISEELLGQEEKKNVDSILEMIDWDNEMKYMSGQKEETQTQERNPSHMEVYKGDNAEEVSKRWKYILFNAIEKKYSYIDYSNWK